MKLEIGGDHIIRPEQARTIAGKGWTRHDVRSYLYMNAYNLFSKLTFSERYGKIYNRNLPRWYKREQGARVPLVPDPGSYSSVCHRRHGIPLFCFYSRLGPYVVARVAQHRT